MEIMLLNDLALRLVANDFSKAPPGKPTNGGPTKTSRALAIIHLAARDAYAKVTEAYLVMLATLPAPPAAVGNSDAAGSVAMYSAGIAAAKLLYPEDLAFIAATSDPVLQTLNPVAVYYGEMVGQAWVADRANDNSALPQSDFNFSPLPGHHRPDPASPGQDTLGRNWGKVRPFVLANVATDARLGPNPAIDSPQYASAFDHVFVNGRDNIPNRAQNYQHQAAIGLFWAYDGANMLGTPPRLYNQVIVQTNEFKALGNAKKINILCAVNAAMADAGIAAWHWKYEYDFWRPVVAIRESEKEWGPTGEGDKNANRTIKGDPFWLPLGAPKSNPTALPSANFTPNFPAYPSGHATFGTAAFESFALLVKKPLDEIKAVFVSDEFNGRTRDNMGCTRPHWEQPMSLKQAIEQNSISRIYLGVHWKFDAKGGEKVGSAIAKKVADKFKI